MRRGCAACPIFFGAQRFGHDANNLRRAQRQFVDGVRLGRRQRRFALSAARSWVFNRVLAARIAADCWDTTISGEPLCLHGSRSFFLPDPDDDVSGRLAEHDVHPSGPLWGKGDSVATGACLEFEHAALDGAGWALTGLAGEGLRQERRALRLPVPDLDVAVADTSLTLRFSLPRGCFATAVVREFVHADGERIPA